MTTLPPVRQYGQSSFRPSRPTAESWDLKSPKCGFESHLGYQLPMKTKLVYISNDGKQFDNENEAAAWERACEFKSFAEAAATKYGISQLVFLQFLANILLTHEITRK